MKRILFMAGVLLFGSLSAQKGKVGIDTAQPTEILDVKGTVRVQELPVNATASSIFTKADGNRSEQKDQTFTATRTVVADKNGVLGVVEGLPGSGGGGSTPNEQTGEVATKMYEKCTKNNWRFGERIDEYGDSKSMGWAVENGGIANRSAWPRIVIGNWDFQWVPRSSAVWSNNNFRITNLANDYRMNSFSAVNKDGDGNEIANKFTKGNYVDITSNLSPAGTTIFTHNVFAATLDEYGHIAGYDSFLFEGWFVKYDNIGNNEVGEKVCMRVTHYQH